MLGLEIEIFAFLILHRTAKKIRFLYSQKKKLRGLIPNFYIHISMSEHEVQPQSTYIFMITEQCLASSELLTPHRLSTQRVCPPSVPKAEGSLSPSGERVGVNISEDVRHWIGLLQYNPSTSPAIFLQPNRQTARRNI